jgi:hypothetical protein
MGSGALAAHYRDASVCESTLNYRLILAGSISPSPGWFEPPPDILASRSWCAPSLLTTLNIVNRFFGLPAVTGCYRTKSSLVQRS